MTIHTTMHTLRGRVLKFAARDELPDDVAALAALELGRIADTLESAETILATGLANGSPLIEAIRCITKTDRGSDDDVAMAVEDLSPKAQRLCLWLSCQRQPVLLADVIEWYGVTWAELDDHDLVAFTRGGPPIIYLTPLGARVAAVFADVGCDKPKDE
jgi:hypothetical protein